MQSYQFRLQPLLDLRRRQLETEEAKLARLAAARDAMENRKRELEREDRAARAALAAGRAPSIADVQAVGRFAAHVIEAGRELERRVQAQQRKIDEQRRAVTARRRDQELLARLEQEERAAWELAAAQELESLASDSFLAGWNRRSMARRRKGEESSATAACATGGSCVAAPIRGISAPPREGRERAE